MPAVTVDGLAVVRVIIVVIEEYGILYILPVRQRGIDSKPRIIAPLVGITDFHGKRIEFFLGAGLGGIAHPCELVDMLSESLLQVAYQGKHLLLGACREIFFHVKLSESFAEYSVGNGKSTLPSGLLFLHARYCLLEGKGGINEIVAQIRSCRTEI